MSKGRPKGSKNTVLHKWSEEEKQYLKDIVVGKSYKEILKLMNNRFEYTFTQKQIQSAIKRFGLNTGRTGQFEKGFKPWNIGIKGLTKPNSGQFKKGLEPINSRPIGSERLNADGYVYVKVGEPSKWKLKHRLTYEKHYGELSKNDVILFADQDRQNFNIDNLVKVSKAQVLKLNQHNLISEDADLTRVGVNVASLMLKVGEAKR